MTPTATSAIRTIEHVWIPLPDGCHLAAKLWLPVDAEQQPVPAVLEYLPYRKRDTKAARDTDIHGFFARHGYAGVRVDLRGSGDSEGVLRDEYLALELEDALSVLQWIAAQPWCSGRVGLFGLSWGGFNALQIAALRPPELGAILTVCASDDRYADDVHYMGGCLLTDNLSWASTMFAYNACPPDPAIVGERWREMWLERLAGSGLWLQQWLEHPWRDDYWKHASVCEDYAAIEVPVFAVSGWADGYSNSVFRLMEHLRVPRRGLVGPWGHKYPHLGGPGPAIDFLSEAVRWWDQWLKGEATGVPEEPMLRCWMQDASSPSLPLSPGHWVAEDRWPAASVHVETLYATRVGLEAEPGDFDVRALTLQSPLSVGLFAGKWCSYSEATDLPWDQREEDGGALVFDTEPLEAPLEILGKPAVELDLAVDKPVAMVAVRLSDIDPSGRATRVTYGLLNLTHRLDHESPSELEPGRRYRVPVEMNEIGQHFRPGHSIRLAISTSYWPLAWPSPEPARLALYPGSSLKLPVRPPHASDRELRPLAPPPVTEQLATTLLEPARREWTVQHNLGSNEVSLNVVNDDARYRLEHTGVALTRECRERYSYVYNDYTSVSGEVEAVRAFDHPGDAARQPWHASSRTRTRLTATPTHFRIRATLDAYDGETRLYAQSWDELIPRRLV